MALQFVLGGSGSGKSTYLFERIRKEASAHPHTNYLVLVPDQFTLETQRIFVESNKGRGILNIDVLSFHRLAYRAFEEVPALRKTVLEDVGKIMILRKVFSEQKNQLQYFKRGLQGAGFLDECKSFLCELAQYAVTEEDLETMIHTVGEESLMAMKLSDIRLIYHAFQEKMGDTYMMAEELVPQLTRVVSTLELIKNSVICLDGFTGFTPTQYELLSELLSICQDVYVTVTTDRTEKRGRVFGISSDTIRRLTQLARERQVPLAAPVFTGQGKEKVPYRVADNEELAFLEKHLFAYGVKPWQGQPENVKITLCHRERDEAAYVARRIWWLIKEEGYRYDEIAVVTANIATYEQALSQEMDKLGIRYFMDYKKSIGANAMAEYIMAFANMVERGMDYESTFRFLRCGLSPLSLRETDLLENYVVAQGRRGLAAYQQEWQYEVTHLDLVEINSYRLKFLESVEETMLALKGGKKTVREFTGILYQLVVKNRLYEQLQEKSAAFEEAGKPILAREYRSIYRLMMNLWDELVELLGDEVVTFREYQEILGAGISEGLVGFIPPTSHQVVVGDVRRTRLHHIKVLFFLGVNDDFIPKSKGAPGILSESERRKIEEAGLELAPDAEKESYTEQFYLYLALTKASRQVILTYSAMGADGSSKRPAYLIQKVRGLFPELTIHREEERSLEKVLGSDCGRTYLIRHLADGSYEGDDTWWQIASFYEKRQPGILQNWLAVRQAGKGKTPLRREAAERLYGKILDGSVTRLEQFVQCPYAHFVRYGLQLSEREQYEVSGLDRGNIFHHAMEHFSHRLEQENREWQDLTEEEMRSLAEECMEYSVERYQGRKYFQSHRTEFMIKRLKHELANSVWAMWHQMKEGDFHQLYAEKRFSGRGEEGLRALCIPLEQGHEINLRGVMDRVDLCSTPEGEMVKIVDYKSSDSLDLSLAQVYHGLQMQLVAYMSATRELVQRNSPDRQVIPAAMLYYTMKEKNLEWKKEDEQSRRIRALEAMKSKGYVNREPSVVKHLDSTVVNGEELVPVSASSLFPIEVDKAGEYKKKSQVMSTEQFELLMAHTRRKMTECGNQILAGEISDRPYSFENRSGCDYCEYRSVCGRENKQQKNGVRRMENMSDEEVWEVLDERD